ncbi:HPr family phosphocarrier protein [Glaciihabitans sp. INWT7]|uniref:dihydroxyacetone kinase phosphoryl donor subunit DhaM n=1 Tax=Glaciihabitans sp. INWT7 TaxID=2596912 RepID=UPI0016266A7E|nr:dihydroxyacetone kinase phosphoryl donor subunit DhaM [Glaciihabitans sp. INWT7]QNE47872.1 HPr family phosphocarrier protein [Glaciihabitans sp. INWT7]
MIGVVVVSHSPALAHAAVDLALQMVPGEKPAIAIAAGAGEGLIGTDATAVSAAIDEVASPDGVLVIMDLGSAVMSAEMALDFRSSEAEVRLSSAPFVEGILAAVVTAAGGASLDDVDREARGALEPKISMLGDAPAPEAPVPEVTTSGATASGAETAPAGLSAELTIVNPDGLHARPAATLVSTLAGFDAKLTVVNTRSGTGPVAANSLIGLLSLGAKSGDVLTVAASGAQAAEALARVTELVTEGFGEV